MRYHLYIFFVGILLFMGGCSNTSMLAEDQLLYTGQKKVYMSQVPEEMSTAAERQILQSGSSQKPNNSMLDRRILPPIGLWTYNYWKVNEEKKFWNWLYKAFVGSPVLVSDINPELRAQKIENDLFDQGYFHARAWSKVDTSSKNPKKAMVEYFVEVGSPYHYNQVEFDSLLGSIDTLVREQDFQAQIKSDDQFDVSKLVEARAGVSRQFQNLGYYYFNNEIIDLVADTALGNNSLDLRLSAKRDLPPEILSKYSIESITIYISKSSDSASTMPEPFLYEDLTIYTSGDYLKPELIKDALYFKTGDQYSLQAYQNTVARLNKLGVFSYVRISYEDTGKDSLANKLKVRIDLKIADQISLNFETDLVVKSTGFVGPGVRVGVSNSNTFKGAERVHVDLKGSIEWQWGQKEEDQLGTFSYEFGINSGLSFPKLILPGSKSRFKGILNQETGIDLNFDILTRVQYYSMFSAMTAWKYSWGKTEAIRHSFSPAYLNSVSLLATTPEFDSIIDENIYIRKSFEEQFILGVRYDFSYDNTYRRQPQNIYFQTGISSSGNLLDLFESIGKDESDRPYEILNTIYSQHLKLTSDFRYYLNGFNKTLALRVYAGVGMPYLNSTVLPYVEQFFSGGAYSIRGFKARSLGPGSFHEEESTYIDQSGDIKLEANLEFRFGISKITKGALFIETGNIWLINEDENRPGSEFNFSSFTNQLAVGTGLGLRFDFNFFVLRTDVGFPLRTAYVQNDKNWFSGDGSIFSQALFYFAIGYPF